MKNLLFLILPLFLAFNTARASETDSIALTPEISEAMWLEAYQAFVDSMEQTLTYETGTISLGKDIASLQVPAGYKYLNGSQSDMVLTDIWGNPPREEGNRSLGMLVPEGVSVLSDSSFVINITYSEEGYIDDEDAKDIDYAELLEGMQQDTRDANPYREQEGYPTIELVGWAATPFYDAANKKLHWAKELKFGGEMENTLNYNIRVLGRKGYLELNVIGGMYVLDEVNTQIDPILQSVNFKEGFKYSDFNPKLDKIAAYGVGGLIAGKVLAKAGLLAKFGIILAKFWKFIALGIVGLFAGIRRLFTGKEPEAPVETPE